MRFVPNPSSASARAGFVGSMCGCSLPAVRRILLAVRECHLSADVHYRDRGIIRYVRCSPLRLCPSGREFLSESSLQRYCLIISTGQVCACGDGGGRAEGRGGAARKRQHAARARRGRASLAPSARGGAREENHPSAAPTRCAVPQENLFPAEVASSTEGTESKHADFIRMQGKFDSD